MALALRKVCHSHQPGRHVTVEILYREWKPNKPTGRLQTFADKLLFPLPIDYPESGAAALQNILEKSACWGTRDTDCFRGCYMRATSPRRRFPDQQTPARG